MTIRKSEMDRWRERGRTFAGIAEAMADQWGAPAEKELPL